MTVLLMMASVWLTASSGRSPVHTGGQRKLIGWEPVSSGRPPRLRDRPAALTRRRPAQLLRCEQADRHIDPEDPLRDHERPRRCQRQDPDLVRCHPHSAGTHVLSFPPGRMLLADTERWRGRVLSSPVLTGGLRKLIGLEPMSSGRPPGMYGWRRMLPDYARSAYAPAAYAPPAARGRSSGVDQRECDDSDDDGIRGWRGVRASHRPVPARVAGTLLPDARLDPRRRGSAAG